MYPPPYLLFFLAKSAEKRPESVSRQVRYCAENGSCVSAGIAVGSIVVSFDPEP
jgi:hypothetical protein